MQRGGVGAKMQARDDVGDDVADGDEEKATQRMMLIYADDGDEEQEDDAADDDGHDDCVDVDDDAEHDSDHGDRILAVIVVRDASLSGSPNQLQPCTRDCEATSSQASDVKT